MEVIMKKIILYFLVILVFQPLYSQQWQFIGLEERSIQCLMADPANEDVLYAGCAYNGKNPGLFRSSDGGFTWETIFAQNENVYDVDFDPKNSDIMYICAKRLWKTVDKGESWFVADSGIGNINDMSKLDHLIIHSKYPGQILVTNTHDFFNPQTDIYISNNGGKSWEQRDSAKLVSAVEPDSYNENTIYLGDTKTNAVYKTEDFGENWFL